MGHGKAESRKSFMWFLRVYSKTLIDAEENSGEAVLCFVLFVISHINEM